MLLRRYHKVVEEIIEPIKVIQKVNYNEFTLIELKSMAKEKSVEGYFKMNKAQLVELLSNE